MKKCTFCAEDIQDEAIVCRYCGRVLAIKFKDKIELITGKITFWMVILIIAAIFLAYRVIAAYIKFYQHFNS